MRLTCPRCAAQYEIAESAIPPAGREVECSACGHVWRQARAEKSVVNPVRPLSATASAGAIPPPLRY
ncbi:zinc-ribbon domain-containing protein [Paracoccus kondratievae]